MPANTRDTVRSLSDCINIATRSVHSKLNKLVIFRLPLALPPQADDASQYVSGLLHVAPIYIAFESLWKKMLDLPEPVADFNKEENTHACTACDPTAPQPKTQFLRSSSDASPVASIRIRSLLANLHFEGLQRSQALQKDITSLTRWSSRTLAEQLNGAAESPVLSDFLNHIKNSVETSPHVLLAYAWVLYMALFSGGRFIRASLEDIYPEFWVPASAQQQTTATLTVPNGADTSDVSIRPLNFFRFDTLEDGEDLKLAFKKRLVESESVLTGPERDDIVQEARCIFDFMVRLVGELDDICGTDEEAAESRLLSLRSRDSVVVEKERRQQFAETARKVAEEAKIERGLRDGGEGHVKFR
ncbi:heme oxygenase-like protein [Xylariaceae sp. FL1651]|nr:heme oxygenase-like protein [Xylariaceae sp. FL1651]